MSASHGRAISAGSLRPNAAALDSKGLTRELGRSSTLTDDGVARSLEQGHGDRFDHFNLGALLEQLQEASPSSVTMPITIDISIWVGLWDILYLGLSVSWYKDLMYLGPVDSKF